MDFYASTIGALRKDLSTRKNLEVKVSKLTEQLADSQEMYVRMIDAQKLLSTISDDNTEHTLNFITGMVNRVLSEIFSITGDVPRISLKKKLYAKSKPHIVVEVLDGQGREMDVVLQNGAGLRQIVSFMYDVCLIEIRKGRRLILSDEYLNGLHASAKKVISEIIRIFEKGGFQFIFVEYNMNDIGKIYNIEKRGEESRIVCVGSDKYDNDMVFSNVDNVDLSAMDKDYKEESGEDGVLVEEVKIG